MTFGGGGNTPLTNHVHSNATGEGGALSTTLTLMGPDVLYSLITDNTAQVNTNTANIATNTAAIAALSSGAWTRIVNQTQTGGSGQFNVTGLTSTKKYLMFTFAGSFGNFDKLRLRLGSGGSIDTGTNYSWRSGKDGSFGGASGADTIEIMTANSGGNNDFFLSGFMQLNAPSDGTGTADSRIGNLYTSQNDTTVNNILTSFEWDNSTTPMTDIRFYAGGGNDIRGTLCIYESED